MMSALAGYHADPCYSVQRGMLTHFAVQQILRQPHWRRLTKYPRHLLRQRVEAEFSRIEDRSMEDFQQLYKGTPADFLESFPGTSDWVTGSVRILLKCLVRDWRVTSAISEPRLPSYDLPDGRVLVTGAPDVDMFSEAFAGRVLVEIKSGRKPVRPNNAKVARYLGSAYAEGQRLQLPPLRGLLWVSFATYRREGRSGNYVFHPFPVMRMNFIPFSRQWVDDRLQAGYGVTTAMLAERRIGVWH